MLVVSAGVGFLYIVCGRFHLASVARNKIVEEQAVKYKDLAEKLGTAYGATDEDHDHSSSSTVHSSIACCTEKEKIQKLYEEITAPKHWLFCLRFLLDFLFMIFFIVVVSIGVVLVTLFLFVSSVLKILFGALIVWKQASRLFPIKSFEHTIHHIILSIIGLVKGKVPFYIVDTLAFLLMQVEFVLIWLSQFRIDLSTINVTCIGSKAPAALFVNLIVFGAIIIVIQSEMQLFRSIVLGPAVDKYTRYLLSSEYRKKFFKGDWCTWFCLLVPRSLSYSWSVFLLLPTNLFASLDVGPFLRYALTQVVFTPFTSIAFSQFCDAVPGFIGYDSALAFGTTFVGYALSIPIVYELSRVCCPYDPNKAAEKENRVLSQESRKFSQRLPESVIKDNTSSVFDLPNPDARAKRESFLNVSSREKVDWFHIIVNGRWTLFIQKLLTFLAPDLFLVLLNDKLLDSIKSTVLLDKSNRSCRWCCCVGFFCGPCCASAEGTCVHDAVLLKANEEKTATENEEKDSSLPTYWILLQEEARALVGEEWATANPTKFILLTMLLLFVPFGHFFRCGRERFSSVFRRLWVFLWACLGVWTADTEAGYKFNERVESYTSIQKENDLNMTNLLYSQAMLAVIAPRAIMLQLIPVVGGILSIFSINIVSNPLFIFEKSKLTKGFWGDDSKTFPLFVFWDAPERTRREEDGKWAHNYSLIYFSAGRAFFTNSRMVQFLLAAYSTAISILLLETNNQFALISMVCLLLPSAFISALEFVIIAAKVFKIKDFADMGHNEKYRVFKEIYKYLQSKPDSESVPRKKWWFIADADFTRFLELVKPVKDLDATAVYADSAGGATTYDNPIHLKKKSSIQQPSVGAAISDGVELIHFRGSILGPEQLPSSSIRPSMSSFLSSTFSFTDDKQLPKDPTLSARASIFRRGLASVTSGTVQTSTPLGASPRSDDEDFFSTENPISRQRSANLSVGQRTSATGTIGLMHSHAEMKIGGALRSSLSSPVDHIPDVFPHAPPSILHRGEISHQAGYPRPHNRLNIGAVRSQHLVPPNSLQQELVNIPTNPSLFSSGSSQHAAMAFNTHARPVLKPFPRLQPPSPPIMQPPQPLSSLSGPPIPPRRPGSTGK